MTETAERRVQPTWLWCLLGGWLLLAVARIVLSTQVWHTAGDNLVIYWLASLQQDLIWLGSTLLCALIAYGRGPMLTSLAAFFQLILWLIFLADLFEIAGQQQRLLLPWLLEGWQHGTHHWWAELSQQRLSQPLAIPFLLCAAMLAVLWLCQWQQMPHWKNLTQAPALAATGVVLIALSLFPPSYSHPQTISYQNWFTLNAQSFIPKRSPPTWSKPALECTAGDNRQLNAIVLLIPGLSWYQTDRLEPNWIVLPKLSQLMDQYAWWPNYLGHGPALADQLNAMLTAADPWQNPIPESNLQNALPHQLTSAGYRSAYLIDQHSSKTLPLDLQSLGFDTVNVVATSTKQFQEPNAELLAATLAWMSERQAQAEPYLIMTQLPDLLFGANGKRAEATAGQTVDRALDQFVQTLRQIDYFVDGILIVVSGHRAKTPLRRSETTELGLTAEVRLPLVVIGERYAGHGRLDTIARARDFGATFHRLMTTEVCTESDAGDWFGEAPSCSYSIKSRPPNRLLAVCNDGHASIVLAGKHTRIWNSELSDADHIVARIREPFIGNKP